MKKELKKNEKKKKTDDQGQQVVANEKLHEEVRAFKDKLTKLANTFDKELVERDKTLKQYQTGMWDEVQQVLQAIREDT